MNIKNQIIGASSTAGGATAFFETVQAVMTGLVVYAILYVIEILRTKIHQEKSKREIKKEIKSEIKKEIENEL